MVRNGAECCKKIYVKIFVTHLFLTQVCYGLHIDKHVSVLMPIENFTLTYIKSTKTKAKLQKKKKKVAWCYRQQADHTGRRPTSMRI